jgi:hemolysin-activating ACP:hemolysin acyltransferase
LLLITGPFLDKEAEHYYTTTGDINPEDWNSGDKVWHVDFICVKDVRKVMKWTRNYFTKLIGYNQPVNYLRIAEDGTITRRSKKLTHGQS